MCNLFVILAQSDARKVNTLMAQSFTLMSTPSLYTLPIELLHRIIDYVDTETVFFSFRNVCKHFYNIINSYNQYRLDFRLITKPAFHRVRHFLRPENVISLIVSNEHKTPGQIGLFLSLFDISAFTRLRSLTLVQINDSDLIVYLKHISTCPLISLSIEIRRYWLTSLTIETLQLFKHCPIRHLTIAQKNSPKQVFHIFLSFPDLQTLVLQGLLMPDVNDNLTAPVGIKSKLKSLTIDFYSSSMDMIRLILSCTPSLTHLKLIGCPMTSGLAWDGYWWAELIQNNLPQLQFFQFFFEKRIHYSESTYDIESIITSFRTAFWFEKRWYVACDYYKDTHELKLYSLPICKPTISYRFTPKKISCSNSTNDTPYIMDTVCSLILNMIPTTTDTYDKSLLPNRPLFPRVNQLTLLITNEFSNGSIDYLSSLVDFSHLDTLALTFDLSEESFNNIRTIIKNFLDRVYNVQSINLRAIRSENLAKYVTIIYPMLPGQVKHLIIDIKDTHGIQWILDQFENFSSITVQWKIIDSSEVDSAIAELHRKGKDFTYYRAPGLDVSFWFGKQKLNN